MEIQELDLKLVKVFLLNKIFRNKLKKIALALAGARVILCSRSIAAGEKAIKDEIIVDGEGGYSVLSPIIVVKQLDLNSLKSVKTLAEDLLLNEERIDFLICNAGIMALPNLEFTEDGFEKQIGVNVFGHFYCKIIKGYHRL